MSRLNALSLSVGVCAAGAALLTSTAWTVPVWVVFLSWAAYFALGSGLDRAIAVACSIVLGVLVATAALLIARPDSGPFVLALCVGAGSVAMVQLSRVHRMVAVPAVVFGFAMTVSTTVATGIDVTAISAQNPALTTSVAAVAGVAFGVLSERGAALIERIPGSSGRGIRSQTSGEPVALDREVG